MYESLVKEYPILSMENPFPKDDLKNLFKLTSRIGDKVLVIGNDLLVMNLKVWILMTFILIFHINHVLSASVSKSIPFILKIQIYHLSC